MIDTKIIDSCEKKLQENFRLLDEIALFNQEKVLKAFQKRNIALRHFVGTTGYGYGDEGKEALNDVISDIFYAESAICSPNIVSGTHALSLCLFGILRPKDKVLCVSGTPYDTLTDVINGENNGSLKEFGVEFEYVNLVNGKFDFETIANKLSNNVYKMVYLQRSRGYEWRNALSIIQIKELVDFVREKQFDGCIMLDNCYGEFVDKLEPTQVGVNILAGSMIKNIGGGIAPTGGYVAGDKKYVDLVYNRLTAPSIGSEVGSYAYGYQYFFQGIFLAPHVVKEALKGAMLIGKVLSELGYETSPSEDELPSDIIKAIKFNDKDKLIKFIQNIQYNSPVDSNVTAIPWSMPGYKDEVIMAAGCFVQGASIELSADAPIRPPYIAYFQGGLTYEHCKIVLKNLDL